MGGLAHDWWSTAPSECKIKSSTKLLHCFFPPVFFQQRFSHLANRKNECVHSKSFLVWLYFKILSLITFLGHVFSLLQERFSYCMTRKVGSDKNKSIRLCWLHSQRFAAAKDAQVLTIWLFFFSSPLNNCSNTTFSVAKNICVHLSVTNNFNCPYHLYPII